MTMLRKWADGYENSGVMAEGGVLNLPGSRPWKEREQHQRGSLKRLDRVKLGNGDILIVTGYHPNRPSNCYSGVLENGKGKEYIFGAKHNPVKLDEVTEGHPALVAMQNRKADKAGGMSAGERAVVSRLIAAIEGNNLEQAKLIVGILKEIGF
jgi:hypothetical protein